MTGSVGLACSDLGLEAAVGAVGSGGPGQVPIKFYLNKQTKSQVGLQVRIHPHLCFLVPYVEDVRMAWVESWDSLECHLIDQHAYF